MKPDPVFEAPWHAQVFALTVHLNAAGLFTWSDWASRFGATLNHHGLARDLDGGADYFSAWLETLETLLAEGGLADLQEQAEMRDAWETAYLRTPHGLAVSLDCHIPAGHMAVS